MLVDSHCHLNLLDLTPFDNNLDNVMQAAKDNGVLQMLCVSVDLPTLPAVLSCAERYYNVYASVGIHPNDSKDQPITVAE
jgi:TatD DNase family protein